MLDVSLFLTRSFFKWICPYEACSLEVCHRWKYGEEEGGWWTKGVLGQESFSMIDFIDWLGCQ